MLIALSGGFLCAVHANHTLKLLETKQCRSVQRRHAVLGRFAQFMRKIAPKLPHKRAGLDVLQLFFFKSLDASLII
jgi:glycyl-tRNA synthetase alpha subunit